jgi:hypothetical protein
MGQLLILCVSIIRLLSPLMQPVQFISICCWSPAQAPSQWVPATVSQGLRRQERQVYHSRPSSADVNNGGAHAFIAQG